MRFGILVFLGPEQFAQQGLWLIANWIDQIRYRADDKRFPAIVHNVVAFCRSYQDRREFQKRRKIYRHFTCQNHSSRIVEPVIDTVPPSFQLYRQRIQSVLWSVEP